MEIESFGSQFLEPMSKEEARSTLGGNQSLNGPCPTEAPGGTTCVQVTVGGSTTHTFDHGNGG
jgi:hypothetical protein